MATATTARKTAATQRSTAAKKAATTRAANARRRSAAAKKAAATRAEVARTPIDRAQEYAEKAVLVPVGAALVVRDGVVSSVTGLRDQYATQSKAQAQLKRFERRGSTARTKVEREVRKTKTKLERELRQRRTRIGRQLDGPKKSIDLGRARVENVLQTGLLNGAELYTGVTKRFS